ncbi:DNA-binding response regulator, NarL/FixJ family, contains REC and HTH domains [Kosakonia oryzendophytica]|uniref:DNA-binding response regulator, NarL/FixJ family, contains REC and HTH domains n=1 Tax=Kosakonia oryzendophytica TaxID=1005665 RepID=A0A1C4AI99_9ENTR|nr:LuxR C-terminal-related transcriptional regulator [Kosakonia oryzendophytica]AMO50137.1 Response regulator receiver protein [Enterobacter sp. FY-07]WBT57130.1 LuxR C-terminal-related transcriptional regulator [Kosakonia oryzendophytica]SCB94249.1 DNA-binding response regulator, NarL/FixJ family, contains REC and HTH domains [Kosakonia oryzendophytica]
MTIYGKDRLFIYGIEKILRELRLENRRHSRNSESAIYVTTGMDIVEMYALFFSHPPGHYAIFISSERHFDSLTLLFPGLVKLCLAENIRPEELRQALNVMTLLSEQNRHPGYHHRTFKFTRAEQQVMRLLLRGHSVDDIARIRGVSPTTVSVQRNGMMKRTGTRSLQELCSVYAAMRSGAERPSANSAAGVKALKKAPCGA